MVETLLLSALLFAAPPPADEAVAVEAEAVDADDNPTAIAPEEPYVDPEDLQKPGVPLSYTFAQTARVEVGSGRTRVSVEHQAPTPKSGYLLVRWQIDNTRGPTQTLNLSFAGNNGTTRPVTRQVEVREGERRTVTMPVPFQNRYGMVRARGPGIDQPKDASIYFNTPYPVSPIALTLGATTDFEKFARKAPAHSSGNLTAYAIPLEDAPGELAAYVGYDAVVIPRATLDQLDEAQRRAIEGYVATGGTLVLGQGSRGTQTALPLLKEGASGTSKYGFGKVIQCGETCTPRRDFFDRPVPVTPKNEPPQYQRRYGNAQWEVLLPQATAPLGKFLFIIGLFTIAIGPGSLYIAKRRSPAVLLFTIPATAFVTCALIIGYSLAQDGFTVHGGAYGYTLLDSKNNRAITGSVTAYYANLSPGKPKLSSTTALIGPLEGNGEIVSPSMEWTDGLTLSSDFLPSRTYREWGFLAVEPTRARLVLKKQGNGYAVQNALGSRINSITFMADDALWTVGDVRDGQEKEAKRASGTGASLKRLSTKVDSRFAATVPAVVTSPLKEGQFLAVLEGQGFTPTAGLSIIHHDSEHVVRGEVVR